MSRGAAILVTGLGAWSAAGGGAAALWEAALRSCDAPSQDRGGDASSPQGVRGAPPRVPGSLEQIPDPAARRGGHLPAAAPPPPQTFTAPDPPPDPGLRLAPKLDRQARLALAAAREAWHAAQLDRHDPARVAILVGTARGPAAALAEGGPARPAQATRTALASASGALSLAFGVTGPCFTVSATCASGAQAIALGATLLAAGEVDAVLAGGAEAPLTPAILGQFAAAGLLGTACRPFDMHRDGLVPGEGAAFLALERAPSAVAPLARLAGWATGAEAHQRAAARADGAGLQRVLRRALAQAGLVPADIGLVFAHGTGTRVNDAAEAAALAAVFGDAGPRPWITGTKAGTGHALGASSALEAVLAVQALRHGVAPPLAGCRQPDAAAAGLRLARRAEALGPGRAVATLAQGFWGNNAALVFGAAGG